MRIDKTLLAFLLTALVFFLAWAVLGGGSNSHQPSSAPTVLPDGGFVVNIPQKALIRNYVTVSVEVAPLTSCELTYIPPSGEIHQTKTMADKSGLCVWKWKVDESDGKGAGRLIFTIGGISETHFMEIRSSF